MEELKKEEQLQPEVQKTEESIKVLTLTGKLINMLFAICSLFFMVVTKICVSFGLYDSIFRGIMSVFYVLSAFVGVVWSILRMKGKPTFEFFINAAVLLVALVLI